MIDSSIRQDAYKLLDKAHLLQQQAYEMLSQENVLKTETLDGVAIQAISRTSEIKTGSLILGNYRVCTTLGVDVFTAIDQETEKMKLVKIADNRNTMVRNGFEISMRLQNIEGIQKPLECRERNGRFYAIYEYIPGENLSIAKPVNVMETFRELCEIVENIHKQGVIHRDIKPGNIILDMNGHVHLIDLDIAIRTDEQGYAIINQALGTPKYASPEMKESNQIISYSADIYSLGKVLEEICPKDDKGIQKIIEKATATRTVDRYKTVFELKQDLLSCK